MKSMGDAGIHGIELLDANRKFHDGVDKDALLVFTNHPHHYAAADELDQQNHTMEIMPARAGCCSPVCLHELRKAVFLYGKFPKSSLIGSSANGQRVVRECQEAWDGPHLFLPIVHPTQQAESHPSNDQETVASFRISFCTSDSLSPLCLLPP